MEKIQLENDIANLKTLEAGYKRSVFEMQELAERGLPALSENYANLLQQASADLKAFQEQHPENADFKIELDGKVFDERAEAGKEFEKAIVKCSAKEEVIQAGKYFGFDVTVEKNKSTYYVDKVGFQPLKEFKPIEKNIEQEKAEASPEQEKPKPPKKPKL